MSRFRILVDRLTLLVDRIEAVTPDLSDEPCAHFKDMLTAVDAIRQVANRAINSNGDREHLMTELQAIYRIATMTSRAKRQERCPRHYRFLPRNT